MITTILFDIYGTLIDISTDERNMYSYEAISKWMGYKGIYIMPDQLKWFYHEEFARRIGEEENRAKGDVFKEIIDEFEARIQHREIHPDADVRDVFKSIILKYKQPPEEELARLATDLSHLFRAMTRKNIFVYPTVKPALDTMRKQYRLGIVSNAQEAFTMPELALYDLAPYFETIVLSSQVGVKKPGPRIFSQALKNMNVKPEETVFVGNDLKADIMGASRMGMKTIYLAGDPGMKIRGIAPDAVVPNVDMFEVLKHIDRMNVK